MTVGVKAVELAGMLGGAHGSAEDAAHGISDNVVEAAVDFGGNFFDDGF